MIDKSMIDLGRYIVLNPKAVRNCVLCDEVQILCINGEILRERNIHVLYIGEFVGIITKYGGPPYCPKAR